MTSIEQPDLPSPIDPIDRLLRADLGQPRLLAASDDGRFGIHSYQFPIVLGWVALGVGRLGLRLDCVDYPTQAPAGSPWDLSANTALAPEHWPIGARAEMVFRKDWSPTNGNAPYLACDRIGLKTHPDWSQAMGSRAWTSTKTLADYLEQVYEALVGATLPNQAGVVL
jgi:hypothetical protein